MKKTLQQYRFENDNINLFVNECCELIGDDVGTQTKILYEAYHQWCKSSGYFPLGKGNFNKQLAIMLNLDKKRIKGEPCDRWVGISLLNDF